MKHQKITAYIDFNGTILNDSRLVCESFDFAFKHFGRSCSFSTFQEKYEWPIETFFLNMGFSQNEAKIHRGTIWEYFHEAYTPFEKKVGLREGVKATLKALRARDGDVVVWSNHTLDSIKQQCDRLGLTPYVDRYLANKDITEQKLGRPKAERLLRDMAEHGVEKQDTVVVGDSPEEPRVAHAFGLTGIALTGGFVSDARLVAARPHYTVSRLLQIPAIVQKIFGHRGLA